jgi:uncharacterized SAM-binding protein YcdF (DUF218 family)
MKQVLIIILVLAGLTLVCAAAFLKLGDWLIVSDSMPRNINVVFTFMGDAERVAYSRELVEKNPGALWVLSDYRDGYARLLRKDGFDMERLIAIDTCVNTLAEVHALSSYVRSRPDSVLSIALVSSPYHMRRIKFMINRNFHDQNARFYYLTVPLDRYKWTRSTFKYWWRSRHISAIVKSELEKIMFFWLIL